MARIITPAPEPVNLPAWMASGKEVVTIALDQNEAVAVRNALRSYHDKVANSQTYVPATSINGSGARVFEALDPVVKANGWS